MLEVTNEVRSSMIAAYYASRRDENVQVNGFVIILDMTGFGAKHFAHLTMEDMKKWNSFWQVNSKWCHMRQSASDTPKLGKSINICPLISRSIEGAEILPKHVPLGSPLRKKI